MIDENDYLRNVLARHHNPTSILDARGVIQTLLPHINAWSNGYLLSITPSGSVAKGTSILGSSDVDIFISVNHTARENLQEVYTTLYNRLSLFSPRKQNVSLGVTINGLKVDVVPAKIHENSTGNHSLWSHKSNTHRTTNILQHVSYVVGSGFIDEIKIIKIWKMQHDLELPSFLLETIVIQTLSGSFYGTFAGNVRAVLTYIKDYLPTARIVDPTKPSNILSDELTQAEKNALSLKAQSSLAEPMWGDIVW